MSWGFIGEVISSRFPAFRGYSRVIGSWFSTDRGFNVVLIKELFDKYYPDREYKEVAGGSELLFNCTSEECKGSTKPTLYCNNYTGFYFCHRCSKRGKLRTDSDKLEQDEAPEQQAPSGRLDKDYVDALHETLFLPIGKNALDYLTARGFSREGLDRFCIGYSPALNAIAIPNLDHNGKAISLKYRHLDEQAVYRFSQEGLGGLPQLPYGLWLLDEPRNTELHITEAELDAISLKEILGDVQVLGLPGKNAFPKAKNDDRNGILAFLKEYKKIYLYPDREVRAILDFTKHAEILGTNRCVIVKLPAGFKDINDMLVGGITKEAMTKIIRKAEDKSAIDSYKKGADLWGASIEAMNELSTKQQFSSGLTNLDIALNGIRPGELTIIAGEAGSGKTTLATQILYDLFGQKAIAAMGSFEMPIESAVIPRLVSLFIGKNVFVHRADLNVNRKPPILDQLFFVTPGTIDITTKMVANHLDELYTEQYLAQRPLVALVIDNLSRFRPPRDLKTQDYLKWEEENIIEIKDWTRKYPNLHIILLAHLNKSQDNGMTKNRIRGSAVIAAEADNILLLSASDKGDNRSKLLADKVRSMAGVRGSLIELTYSHETTRLSDTTETNGEY